MIADNHRLFSGYSKLTNAFSSTDSNRNFISLESISPTFLLIDVVDGIVPKKKLDQPLDEIRYRHGEYQYQIPNRIIFFTFDLSPN